VFVEIERMVVADYWYYAALPGFVPLMMAVLQKEQSSLQEFVLVEPV
jgi:hypothetical protein